MGTMTEKDGNCNEFERRGGGGDHESATIS